jgi:hypothetical protein
MAPAMTHVLVLRRVVLACLCAAAGVGAIVLHAAWQATHAHLVYLSGWALLACLLCLTAYNARKKLPFLPLLSSRTWFQLHVYLGLFTGLLFLLHLQWRWPTGRFEGMLASLFTAVTLSGIFGWWLSRTLPPRLTTAGGEVPFDRIPIVRRDLRLRAEKLVLDAIGRSGSPTLADFYSGRLAGFFQGPANFIPHVRGSRRPLNRLLAQISELRRFVKPEERDAVNLLAELVRQKDALDFHRAMHLLLKGWLFVHVPLTYGLLVFTAVHVVVVYAFSGGVR